MRYGRFVVARRERRGALGQADCKHRKKMAICYGLLEESKKEEKTLVVVVEEEDLAHVCVLAGNVLGKWNTGMCVCKSMFIVMCVKEQE